MRFYLIYFFFSLILYPAQGFSNAGNRAAIDSLENILKKANEENSIAILNKLSNAYLDFDLNKSLDYAERALFLSERYEIEESIAYANLRLGDAYFEMSRFQMAIFFYENALNYFYEQKAPDNKIYIYTKLGHSERMLSNYSDALFYYQKPLNLYATAKNHKISRAYNNIGNIYKLHGKFSESIHNHNKALKAANLMSDQAEIASSFKFIGSLYWKNSQYDSSLIYYEKSLEIYREIGDTLNEATTINNIGVVYKDIGEFKKALDYNLKALELRIQKGNQKEIANSYNSIGSIYISINELNNALEFYMKSLSIRENIRDILGVAQSQTNIALVFRKKDDYLKSLEFFNKSLDNYTQIGNISLIANSINHIGNIYKKLNRYDLALENYLKTLKLREKIGDQNEVASVLNNIGIIYDDINNHQKALESFSKSLEIKRVVGNKREIAYSLHIIGNNYFKRKDYSTALTYYEESLVLRKEVGDRVSIANSLKSIGNTYLALKDYKNTIAFLNEAYGLKDEIGDIKGVSNILNDIGNYYYEINNLNKAFEYFNQTLTLSKKTNDQFLISLCYRKLGVILLKKGIDNEGIEHIERSLNVGKKINNQELIKNAYFELYNYYNARDDKSKALENFVNYTIIKDSMISKFNSQRLVEIQMNFELEESHNKISRIESEVTELTTEKMIRDLELKKQKNVRNMLLIIAALILISGILIFYQYLSKRKTNVLLQEKINEVDQSNKLLLKSKENLKILNATKDKFFSIIAHDLRNPFNALHGLTQHLLNRFNDFSKAEMKESIELIYNSADNLLELLENLLYWSRAQRGKMKFSPTEINLSEIISKIFELLKMTAIKKDINFINEIDTNKRIIADADMITVILRNLILNAIKFSHSNSFIKTSIQEHDNYTEIKVMDNGVGISEENIQKLFRIDVHHSTSGTSDEQGSGLGLILCHEFVERHRGKIWVESELDKGSTFTFTIPKKIQP